MKKGSRGGGSRGKHSEDAKEKIRIYRLGKTQSLESRIKMRNAKLGKSRKSPSLETRAKMSLAQSGSNNPSYGKKQSQETIDKRVASIRARKHNKKYQSNPLVEKGLVNNEYYKP